MLSTFTIIGYRPDHTDTCRGCVMGGSPAELHLHVVQGCAAAVRALVMVLGENLIEQEKYPREVASVDIHLLKDGKVLWSDDLHTDDSFDEEMIEFGRDMMGDARQAAQQLLQQFKGQRAQEKLARESAARDKAARAEFEQYQALKEKFG